MRRYTIYEKENSHVVRVILDKLSDVNTGIEDYREAFFEIGKELGKVISKNVPHHLSDGSVLACASEDADWLAKGLLEGLKEPEMPLAVFWTKRYENDYLHISPIVKSYVDELPEKCENLIIVKSIISSSCVVKTQLLRLISSISPKRIIIAAPVMYKDAESNLRNEFPKAITDKFSFFTFAIDDEIKANVIIPGIGGWVYPRLGFKNEDIKNKYMPQMVRERMAL